MLFKKKPISAEYTVYGCSLQIVANKGEIPKAKMPCTIESDDTILIGDIRHYKDRDFCKGVWHFDDAKTYILCKRKRIQNYLRSFINS